MEKLVIIGLAVLGMASNAGPAPPPAIDWIMCGLLSAFMFLMGARFDAALHRWELQPHWRKGKPVKPETVKPETVKPEALRLS